MKYIITDEMLTIFELGCYRYKDGDCDKCKYAGTGFREGCCDFGEHEVIQLFKSNPVRE